MSRNIKRKQEPAHWSHSLDNFPKDKDGVLYVRQSSLAQIKNNVHSYEMQTDAFEQYFRDMGCTGHIGTVVDDEKGKMSGTLDIHEDLFWYAFNRLATIDLNGERLKPAKTGRTTNAQALLMKVIKDDEGYPLYVELNHRDKYVYKKLNRVYSGREHGFGIYIETPDGIFVEKLLERIEQLETVCIDWTDTIEQAKINKEQRERNLKKSIAEAVRKMNHITALMSDPDTPLPKSMRSQYIEDYNGLEKRKDELECQLSPEIEDEANEQQALYQINSLIPRIREGWNSIQERAANLAIRRIVSRKQAIASVKESGIPSHIALEDWNYAQEQSLSFEGKNWSSTGIPRFARPMMYWKNGRNSLA